ncbi:protein translocase subunit secA [Magnetococcus marinus MC-1]|uniref:Protein translocase subunit SecA 3 n=1 Tax=Magnetococcus marinus (strain ATCC BAA-1437 / JCM 17883 / MC-1) TaxID=156889 RepID=SECA3_MAGMM|nr:preprotein translocase subunit SecA [Magnetococcus marinus]A0L9N3.1 RecName: Full=Protein translocase subunit SecA 3 [Magnetococcus marinus MC-1]ABK44676.1 protein translocase subunit secA [Magnetococcus marinus MC-1]
MFNLSLHGDPYPQQPGHLQLSWLDRMGERVRLAWMRHKQVNGWVLGRMAKRVLKAQTERESMTPEALREDLQRLTLALRRDGLEDALVEQAFAHVRLTAQRVLGMAHFPVQLKGGYIMLMGYLAEMDTGEGKTLTATLPAATAALAGFTVHVVTVNEYLARRDAQLMTPLYRALGVTTGVVTESMDSDEKQLGYRANVVYCTSKTLVFDYLRDRIQLGERMKPMAMAFDALVGGGRGQVMLQGLQYAIVDEADSIFVDEARTPLIISAPSKDASELAFLHTAWSLSQQLQQGQDYTLSGEEPPRITEAGSAQLAQLCVDLPPVWQGQHRREEAVAQALTAQHSFDRDVHYIIRDDKVMVVDETTGRVMPDRAWERGLQQLIEIKEGVAVTPPKETLAKISFQLFFRRFLRLSGMSGTCREVGGEIAEVYGLGVVRVAPNRPSKRKNLPIALYAWRAQADAAVVQAVRRCHMLGQPVLVGTRSIAASELLSQSFSEAGLPHRVLNAKQDQEENTIIAEAGYKGGITIATNMAGRGTDIKLSKEVQACGGLHVILTERHDNRRVDRQLAGRCARQGDPGSWQEILSLEDELTQKFLPLLGRTLRAWLALMPHFFLARWLGMVYYRWAQSYADRGHRRVRRQLMKTDFQLRQSLSFTGEME